jgi:hypothetical protein
MGALLARLLGSLAARTAVREAAAELVEKYGWRWLLNFIRTEGKATLQAMTKEDILALAEGRYRETAGKLFSDRAFTKSNAKKVSGYINRKIDFIEKSTREYVERRSMVTMQNRYLDAAVNTNIFSDAFGKPLSGRMPRSKAFTAARGLASNTLESFLFPFNRTQAFAGGFLRGLSGETLSRMTNRLIAMVIEMPKNALATPKVRIFIRTVIADIKYLQSIGEVTNAKKLYHAVQTAYKAANKPIPGVAEHLTRYSIAGNVTGRVTAAGGLTYFWQSDAEKQRRVEEFRRSLIPFAKEYTKTHVEAYIKRDGTRVKSHYRKVLVA